MCMKLWAGRISALTIEHSYRPLFKVWEAGLKEWQEDERGKRLLAEAKEHWSLQVKDYIVGHKFAEAFAFATRMPEQYDDKNLRNEVVRAWRDYVLALGAQNHFDNAFKALDGVPATSVSAEERNRLFDELKAVWSKKVEDLGGTGQFVEALQVLDQAHPEWEPKKTELLERLQKILVQRIDDLRAKGKFEEALKLIDDKALMRLKVTEVDQCKTGIKKEWLSVIDKQQEPEKSESLTIYARYFSISIPARDAIADIKKLIGSRKPSDVDAAIAIAGKFLKSENPTIDQADRLCRALEQVSSREHIDRIMALIREYASTKLSVSEQPAAALANLWIKRIAICIRQGDKDLAKTFGLFEQDENEGRLLWSSDTVAGKTLSAFGGKSACWSVESPKTGKRCRKDIHPT